MHPYKKVQKSACHTYACCAPNLCTHTSPSTPYTETQIHTYYFLIHALHLILANRLRSNEVMHFNFTHIRHGHTRKYTTLSICTYINAAWSHAYHISTSRPPVLTCTLNMTTHTYDPRKYRHRYAYMASLQWFCF